MDVELLEELELGIPPISSYRDMVNDDGYASDNVGGLMCEDSKMDESSVSNEPEERESWVTLLGRLAAASSSLFFLSLSPFHSIQFVRNERQNLTFDLPLIVE